MGSLEAHYLLQETDLSGGIQANRKIDQADIRKVLRDEYDIQHDYIEMALAVTADNLNVPYDLLRADDEGRFLWTARLTLKVRYWQ